jgi:glycine amidinotransferase/scyllo-inosamine-4-phosphate amidinotransferase 1
MAKVNVHSEWDPLREVIVGSATGAQIPTVKDESLHSVDYGHLSDEQFAGIVTGPYPEQVIDEANEDLDLFSGALAKLGIRVHRPAAADFTQLTRTPDWEADGYYAYCPRDSILTLGNEAIETPMALRHRYNEARLYDHIVKTVQAPRPRLLDSLYDRSTLGVPTLRNHEPIFDAANCLKLGRDILFLISNTGNQAGADWLQAHLGPGYRVHPVRGVYAFVHVDSTIVPLRPGLVLLNPERVREDNLPEVLRGWDKIWAPEPDAMQVDPSRAPASKWIALNCLSLSPDVVAVEQSQTNLMRALERHGIEPFPVQLRHMRTLSGGPHCVTLDVVREGSAEDYR